MSGYDSALYRSTLYYPPPTSMSTFCIISSNLALFGFAERAESPLAADRVS